ncbi:CMGA protein, partial [Nyctibius bracteatus]|nr:CMGA protein [Nyctibius bracteatus]
AVSLPVTNDMNKGDTKVMKCIVEVISDTLSKPNPLPISEECLETLRGDERIISILRHQNLLKELQEIAAQGTVSLQLFGKRGFICANERTHQQKKNSGFEDELSEVLESQNDKNKQREEQPTGSLAELAAQKTLQNEDSREEGKNGLEKREPRPRDADLGEKEYQEIAETNDIKGAEDGQRDKALDNHISKDFSEDEQQQQKDEEEQPRGPRGSLELEDEGEQPSRHGQEQSKEVAGERVEREDDGGDDGAEEDPTEAERSLDTTEEDEEMQGDDNDDDALGFGKDGQSSEEEEEEEEQPRALRGGRHRLEDEGMQEEEEEEDTFQPRDAKSEELEEESSREWEDSKRWNKMDELAKQLTSKKRMEENDSGEDPDRSMKMAFRSRKYDFSNPEEDVRRSWKHHSKEDSSEGGFPLAPMPEEKKDEEGSANRRTEDQELESLAAIEAELERVAHKLHELRRG